MSARHHVALAAQATDATPTLFEGHSQHHTRWDVVAAAEGSVHMDFGICRLDPGGSIDWHLHSFEESFFVLEGEVEAVLDGRTVRLGPGDVAWAGVASTHQCTNVGDGPVRWLETQAPQPPVVIPTDSRGTGTTSTTTSTTTRVANTEHGRDCRAGRRGTGLAAGDRRDRP